MPQLYKQIKKKFPLENDPNNAFLEIIHLERHETSLIGELSTKQVMILVPDGRPEERVEVDRGLDREETSVRSVKSWGGYLDENGDEMECNEANKRFWAHDPEFMATLNKFRRVLAKEVAKQRKDAGKN